MSDSGQYDPRLSELIWRFVKLRISLLVLCIFGLLTTWSSIEVGNRKAPEIDNTYCLKIAESARKLDALQTRDFYRAHPSLTAPNYSIASPADFCAQIPDKRYLILYEEAAVTRELSNLQEPADERELERAINEALSGYEATRSEAFRIGLKLTAGYSENEIEANALSIAAVVPFAVIGLLLLYFMIGRQEAASIAQLRLEMGRHTASVAESRDLFAAKSQFFVSPQEHTRGAKILGFLRSPDRFAKAVLLASTLVLLWIVTADFAGELTGFTDTIFEGYSFWLYTATFLAALMIVASHRFVSPTEHEPRFRQLVALPVGHDEEHQNAPRFRRVGQILGRWTILSLAIAALILLLTPWAKTDYLGPSAGSIFGYEWLLPHEIASHWLGAAARAMEPTIFLEIRLELLVALAFLMLCVLSVIRPIRNTRTGRLLLRLRNYFGIAVLFLSVDYLMFMATLQDEAYTLYNFFLAQPGSMLRYSPLPGYWLFSSINIALSLLVMFAPEPAF